MAFLLLALLGSACGGGGGGEDSAGTVPETTGTNASSVGGTPGSSTGGGGSEGSSGVGVESTQVGGTSQESSLSTSLSTAQSPCIESLPLPPGTVAASEVADLSIPGSSANEFSGGQVTWVGDANGDGRDDLLIGSTGGSPIYLFFGREGWPSTLPVSNADASWTALAGEPLSGVFIAPAGDLNHDGFTDILFRNSSTQGGCAIFLWYGGASGWRNGFDLIESPVSFVSENGAPIDWLEAKGAGDLDGDQIDDFLVRANQADGSGRVYLFLSRRDDRQTWEAGMDLAAKASFAFTVPGGGTIPEISASGVGDVNGDGFDDLLVGDPKNRAGGRNAGKLYLLLGRAQWPDSLEPSEVTTTIVGTQKSGFAGLTVAGAGDVDGDGLADFLVAAAPNLVTAHFFLVPGRREGWSQSLPLEAAAVADWSSAGTFDTPLSTTSIPIALAPLGRLDGDPLEDFALAMRTYLFCPDGSLAAEILQVNVLHGKTTWTRGESMAQADRIIATTEDLGYVLPLIPGDAHGDGSTDLLLGSPSEKERAGVTYLLFGPDPGKN